MIFIREIFQKPSLKTLAERELEAAERSQLQARASLEYAGAVIAYNSIRIQRLRAFCQSNQGIT